MTQAITSLQARLSACRGVLVDSNVLLDVATNDPGWGDWSARALAEVAEHTTLIINPIIYAEVSIGYTLQGRPLTLRSNKGVVSE